MTRRIKKKKKRLELIRKIEGMKYGDGLVMMRDGMLSFEYCHITLNTGIGEERHINIDALIKGDQILIMGRTTPTGW